MKAGTSSARVVTLAFGLAWSAGEAAADPLDPRDYASLGAFSTEDGLYEIYTGGDSPGDDPFIRGPGWSVRGVSGDIAVFTFDEIQISSQTFAITGNRPLALLSYGDIVVSSALNVSADGIARGPGGGGSGEGGGGGGISLVYDPDIGDQVWVSPGAGGGGFGGPGGSGGSSSFPDPRSGGDGGQAYGNLAARLQGGSGGGGEYGGGGGGAIELGALGTLRVDGAILADGGNGGNLQLPAYGSGGGSGGGILLHGDRVEVTGLLSARGGGGFTAMTGFYPLRDIGGNGGGGGGRIHIVAGAGGSSTEFGRFDVSGGLGSNPNSTYVYTPGPGGDGRPGEVRIVPEPSGLLMTALGTVALLAARRAGRPTRSARP